MKKSLILATILGLAMVTNVAFAHNEEGRENDNRKEKSGEGISIRANVSDDLNVKLKDQRKVEKKVGLLIDENNFVLMGEVNNVTWPILNVEVKRTRKDSRETISVLTNFSTKFSSGDQTIALSDIKTDVRVLIKGQKNGDVFTATTVMVMPTKMKAFGEVVSKTDTSVTIKNSTTGQIQTVQVQPETKVIINGETKTSTDIKIGDKGFIKFKATFNIFVAKIVNLFR